MQNLVAFVFRIELVINTESPTPHPVFFLGSCLFGRILRDISMARGKIATTKLENPATRHATLLKRRAGLFKKARELSVLCDAEVAVIIISAEGIICEFASSSIEEIVTRFKNCQRRASKSDQEHVQEPKAQVSMEIDPRQNTEKHELRKVLGKDLAQMKLHELFVLEEQLNKGLLYIKDRKMQLLTEQLEQSRIQERQVLQKNEFLLKHVKDLQAFIPPIYYPMPLSVQFPEMERGARPADRDFISSTSFAITNGPETNQNFQHADIASLPSTATFLDYGRFFRPADGASTSSAAPLAVDNRLNLSQQIKTVKPPFHWLSHGVSGEKNAPSSGTSSSSSHSHFG